MASTQIMSRDELTPAQIAEVAELCGLSEDRIEDVYSCTFTQITFTEEGRTSSLSFIYEFGPDVDIDRYLDALREAVARNPIFRTRIVKSSIGYLQAVTNVEHETERLSGDAYEYVKRPEVYDMTLGQPGFRTKVLGRNMVVEIHHNVMDNFSWNTFLDAEIKGVYEGAPRVTRAPYKEFVKQCLDLDMDTATAFWKPRFQGVPAIFPSPRVKHKHQNKIRPPRKIALDHIGTKVPVFQVPSYIEVAWVLTASMYADSEKIAYGLILAGRSPDLDSRTGWLGPMMVGVPAQANIQRTMTIEQLLKDRVVSLRQMQREPMLQIGMDRIATMSEATKAGTEFTAILNFRAPVEKSTEKTEDKSLVTLKSSLNLSSCFPLEIISAPMDDGISMDVNHDLDILPDELMDQILDQFEHTIRAIMDASPQTKIDQLKLLNPHDQKQIFSWNEIPPVKAEDSIHNLFKAKAQEQPESIAIEEADDSATYRKIDELSDRLAHHLQAKGIKLGDYIGHAFHNSTWAIVAILAIAKAGAVCVPVDDSEEPSRTADFLTQTGVKTVLKSSTANISFGSETGVILVGPESVTEWPDNSEPPSQQATPDNLAFITASDASSGPSKRVLVEHSSLVSALVPLTERFQWKSGCRILHKNPYSSKGGITEVLGALLAGSCLCIAPDGSQGAGLSEFLNHKKVQWVLLPHEELQSLSIAEIPSIEAAVLTNGPSFGFRPSETGKVRHFNAWEVSEAAGFSAVAEIDAGSSESTTENVGRPIGSRMWIANARDINQLSPVGGAGELVIEGPTVAQSYLNDAKQTAASFIKAPEWSIKDISTRFLRTGQLARYNSDGTISLIGRSSNRVKIGKEVIQLEEIENQLSSTTEIREAVTLTKIMKGRTHLFAVVSLSDAELAGERTFQPLDNAKADVFKERLDSVRRQMVEKLPSHKLPTMWIVLERLPRTPMSKLDRTAVVEWVKAGNGDKCAINV